MKYVSIKDAHPIQNVDVFVVTDTGKKGIAKYWETTGSWLTADSALSVDDVVIKWKYAEASNKFADLCKLLDGYLAADSPAFKDYYLKKIKELKNE